MAKHQNKLFTNKIDNLIASLPKSEEVSKDLAGKAQVSDISKDIGDKKTSVPKSKGSKSAFTFNFVTPRNMTRIIRRLKNIRAMAMDEIETEVWKKGVTVLAGPITRICNLSMSTGVFPDVFKLASYIQSSKAVEKIPVILGLTALFQYCHP